jgi:hypothetical protein
MSITIGSSVGDFDSADTFQAILKAAINMAVIMRQAPIWKCGAFETLRRRASIYNFQVND